MLDFLKIILSWPVVIFIIFWFLRKNIARFIDEISELDWGGRKITRKENQPSIGYIKKIPTKKQTGSKWDYRKLFLDSFLKPNTVAALKWFYHNPGEHSLIEFKQKFSLPSLTGRDDSIEKNAILAALYDNELLNLESSFYKISTEGEKYLRYRMLI